MRWKPRRLRRYIALGMALITGFCIGAVGVPIFLAGEIYEYQDTVDGVHLPPIDAIVCLAGGRGRIAAAGDLWYRYWEASQRLTAARVASGEKLSPGTRPGVPILYISGSGPQITWSVLRKHLRSGVREVVPIDDVYIERESFNTETNARWLARIAAKNGWKRIILVTSPYHMRRAQMIFQRILQVQGVRMQIETLSVFAEPFDLNEWRGSLNGIHVTLVEYLKWIYYRYWWKPQAEALPASAQS